MPVYRSTRRATRQQPKYTFSDEEEDEFTSSPDMNVVNNPLPTPPSSATPPARSSHTRKRPTTHVRRPPNAFMIFRSEFCEREKMSEHGIESDHRHISRIVGHVWNNLAEHKKDVYRERAQVAKAAHEAANPGYRYAPAGRATTRAPVKPKPKPKHDSNGDTIRCRQLAELLISGMKGDAFQEAAKGLAEGVVDVELTQRTSQPAPKRPRHARRRPTRTVPAVRRKVSVEVNTKEESPSPPCDLGSPSPPPSLSSSGALDDTPDAEAQSQTQTSTPALSLPPGHSEPESFKSALQLASYYNPTDHLVPLPSLNHNVQSGFVPYANLPPGATSELSLAQLCHIKQEPASPRMLDMPHSLPRDTKPDHDTSDAETSVFLWLCSMSALPVAPPPPSPSPTVSPEYHPKSEGPLPPAASTSGIPWKASADTETFLSHEVDELSLCYPDDPEDEDVDFDEYLTGL